MELDNQNDQYVEQAVEHWKNGRWHEAYQCLTAYQAYTKIPSSWKLLDFRKQHYPAGFFTTVAASLVIAHEANLSQEERKMPDADRLKHLNDFVRTLRSKEKSADELKIKMGYFMLYDFPVIFKKALLLDKLKGTGRIPANIDFEQTGGGFGNFVERNPDKEAGPIQELFTLVGLQTVKREVQSLINLVKIRQIKRERNMQASPSTLHMVFTGSPGTGKTTVARIIARVFHEIGILSRGHLVETDRSGLVGEYIGQTAIKTKEKVNEALGGVLFIDEAYALAQGGEQDFGKEALSTLVALMENHRDDLVVIMAGYTNAMGQMLTLNEGLKSRIFKIIEFPDYTLEELTAIFQNISVEKGYKLSPGVVEKAEQQIQTEMSANPQAFGNARGVRRAFERVEMQQANRLATVENITDDDLIEIQEDDLNI
jgi:SpoVK/Ycf46/Vps4 family AAA+-type ATPase